MSNAVQAHSKAMWRVASAATAVPTATPAYLVAASAGVATIGDTHDDEAFVFADTTGTGTYLLMPIADYDPNTMDRLDAVRLGDLVRFY